MYVYRRELFPLLHIDKLLPRTLMAVIPPEKFTTEDYDLFPIEVILAKLIFVVLNDGGVHKNKVNFKYSIVLIYFRLGIRYELLIYILDVLCLAYVHFDNKL